MCGLAVGDAAQDHRAPAPEEPRGPYAAPSFSSPGSDRLVGSQPSGRGPVTAETHHYHHHYHHHYFPAGSGYETGGGFRSPEMATTEKVRHSSPILRGESMSRAEAGVRRVTQEWVLACNTRHLDDLLDLYVPDAMLLRSNHPPVRGVAGIREFFFNALDAGLGEVEVEPIRVEIAGDLAYEAGKCKALVPSAAGKRREERGKYFWVLARQNNGEWKIACDSWSSDLSLVSLESDIGAGLMGKSGNLRKGG